VSRIIQSMVLYYRQKDDSIFRNNQDMDILLLPAYVICKTQPASCFSCKTDILWVALFLQNRGENCDSCWPYAINTRQGYL